jgi:hypothetical protein
MGFRRLCIAALQAGRRISYGNVIVIVATLESYLYIYFVYTLFKELGYFAQYRLDDRGSIPGRANDFFSSLCFRTSSEAHPACCPMGTGVTALPGHNADHSPLLVPR